MGVVLHEPIAKFRRTLGDRYIQIYSLMSRYLDKPNTTLRRRVAVGCQGDRVY